MSLQDEYYSFLQKIKVGIHEASSITKVPARKIRYWQDKGYVEPVCKNSSSRQYDLVNLKKIILIQELVEEGYTLEASAKKVEARIKKLNDMMDLILPSWDFVHILKRIKSNYPLVDQAILDLFLISLYFFL